MQFEGVFVGGEMVLRRGRALVGEGAVEQRDEFVFGERLQRVDAAAGEQRGDDFEGGVLGGGADQADGAALDVGQEGVLLRLVEAMDFVDEEDGARAVGGGLFRVDHHLLDLLDAGEDGGELDEGGVGGLGDDLGERGFADAGRPPEDHRRGVVALDLHAQGLAGAEQMLLADVFVERARAHALGERRGLAGGGWGEFGCAAEETHLDAALSGANSDQRASPVMTLLSRRMLSCAGCSLRWREAS